MRLSADRLADELEQSLLPVYVVYGDELVLAGEACDAIRGAAAAQGYIDRRIMVAERGFDWDQLAQSTETLSLFADRQLLELRLPTCKPGDAGSKALVAYCQQPPEDTLLLVWTGKLDRAQLNSKWFKALDQAGASVPVYPIDAGRLPGWIATRMRAQGLVPGNGVCELLAYRHEGNLLAVVQEIEKLALLFEPGPINLEDVGDKLGSDARFDVFGFVDTCLKGDGPAAARALSGLRNEGIAPTLILWALTREIRLLEQAASGLQGGESESQVFSRLHVWQKKQALMRAALRRGRVNRWRSLIQAAARADRVLKGRAGGDGWQAIQALSLALAGVRMGA